MATETTQAELADPDRWHDRRWLPILGPPAHDLICIDCDVAAGEPAPIRRPDISRVHAVDNAAPVAPSLGALVAHWIECIQTEMFVFERASGRWDWVSANVVLDTA